MFRYIYILGLIIFFALSCKKYGEGNINGEVLETGTNLPIEGAKVYVISTYRDFDPKLLDSVITNSEGKFKFFYKKLRHCTYSVVVSDVNHIKNKTSYSSIENKKSNLTLYLDPVGFLKLRVKKNTTAQTYIITSQPSSYNSERRTLRTPAPFDTLLGVYKVRGNDITYVAWDVYSPNDKFTEQRELNIATNDTVSLTMEFD